MSQNILKRYFGPLPREYCAYFYVLSLFFGIYVVILLFLFGGYLIMNFSKLQFPIILGYVFSIISAFVVYFANRLLNTICVNSTSLTV